MNERRDCQREKNQDGRDFSSEKDLGEPVGEKVGKRWERQEKTHKEKGPPKGKKSAILPRDSSHLKIFPFWL